MFKINILNTKLKQLYQSVILGHNNHPFKFEKNEGAQYQLEAYNALCGDRFTLYFDIEEDKFTNVTFHGFGCAISKASSSVLVKKIENQSIEFAKQISQQFFTMLEKDMEIEDEELEAFSAAKAFPGRSQCATLSWEEFQAFLEKFK